MDLARMLCGTAKKHLSFVLTIAVVCGFLPAMGTVEAKAESGRIASLITYLKNHQSTSQNGKASLEGTYGSGYFDTFSCTITYDSDRNVIEFFADNGTLAPQRYFFDYDCGSNTISAFHYTWDTDAYTYAMDPKTLTRTTVMLFVDSNGSVGSTPGVTSDTAHTILGYWSDMLARGDFRLGDLGFARYDGESEDGSSTPSGPSDSASTPDPSGPSDSSNVYAVGELKNLITALEKNGGSVSEYVSETSTYIYETKIEYVDDTSYDNLDILRFSFTPVASSSDKDYFVMEYGLKKSKAPEKIFYMVQNIYFGFDEFSVDIDAATLTTASAEDAKYQLKWHYIGSYLDYEYTADYTKPMAYWDQLLHKYGASVASIGFKAYEASLHYESGIDSVEISQSAASLKMGEGLELSADVYPAYAKDRTVKWSSSNERVAAVSEDGTVTALRMGTAVITAASTEDDSRKASCTITVTKPEIRESFTMTVGETKQFTCPNDGGGATHAWYGWAVDYEDLAALDTNDMYTTNLTAKKAGTVILQSTYNYGTSYYWHGFGYVSGAVNYFFEITIKDAAFGTGTGTGNNSGGSGEINETAAPQDGTGDDTITKPETPQTSTGDNTETEPETPQAGTGDDTKTEPEIPQAGTGDDTKTASDTAQTENENSVSTASNDGNTTVELKKPTATAIQKLTAKKKAFVVKWKKKASFSGYQVQYSTSKKFKNAKKKTILGSKTTSIKITGLKSGKKYYVRIRTMNVGGNKTKYSSWSKSKSIKIK